MLQVVKLDGPLCENFRLRNFKLEAWHLKFSNWKIRMLINMKTVITW